MKKPIPIEEEKYLSNVIQMYNLLEYLSNFSKILGTLYHYTKDELAIKLTNSELQKFKINYNGKASAGWWYR